MKHLLVLGILGGVACAALAQDDPVETRRYTADFLLQRPADAAGVSLGLAMDAIGTQILEANGGPVTGEELVAILKADVAPGTWVEGETSIEYRAGLVVARHRRSVLDAVSAWLVRARARHGRRVVVDAALVVVPHERWGRAEPRELAAGAGVVKSARIVAGPGQRAYAQDLTQLSYVRDHDVQISTSAAALDPIVDVLNTGALVDLRALPAPGGEKILLEVRVEAAVFEAMEDKKLKLTKMEPPAPVAPPAQDGALPAVAPVAKDWEALVQLPRTTWERARGQVIAAPGETVVAAAMSRADGVLVLLLTPTLTGEAAPAGPAPGGLQTRLYDVSAITAKIQDWSGPRVELTSPSAGGAGPLTGATFTLDEPQVSYGEDSLRDDLRAIVDAPGTPSEQSAVESTYGSAVSVRATPEQHLAVEKKLEELFRREVRTLTTEAAVFSFRAGLRADLAKQVPALAPGGTQSTDAELAALFEEARKGAAVRLAAFVAVSGRPYQRVSALSGRQQAYVQDFEPQVSTLAAVFDPIIGVQISGIGLDARPWPRAEDGSTRLELKAWTLSVEMAEEKQVSTGGGPVQRPRATGFVWSTDAVCRPGRWTLAALESRGEGAAQEEVALFVRVR